MGSNAASDLTGEAAARLSEVITAVFDDFDATTLSPALRLGDIPDWDSMNSVNLVLELESGLDADLQGVVLTADETVGDVLALLREKGVAI